MNNIYNVKTDGFFGELLCPAEDKYPGKALICFSGSDGNFDLTRTLAGVFRARGLTTLALAYVGQEADSLTLVVDENGNRVCGNTDLYENLQNNKNYTNIISANEKSLKIRFAGKRAVISVLKSDINGWIYLRMHNYLDFYREIVILRNCLAALGLICILAGLYIYSVSIRKISSPITKMISKFGMYKTGSSGSGSKNEFENLDLIVENIIRQKELLEKFHNSSRDWAFAGIILKLCYGNVAEGEEANIEKQLAAQGFKTEGREFSAVVIQITDGGESVKQTGRIELLRDVVRSRIRREKPYRNRKFAQKAHGYAYPSRRHLMP